MTLTHEQTHVRQMRENVGGCKGSTERYQMSKPFRVTQELEVYCVEMDYAVQHFAVNADSNESRIIQLFKVEFDTSGVSCSISRKRGLEKDTSRKCLWKNGESFFRR